MRGLLLFLLNLALASWIAGPGAHAQTPSAFTPLFNGSDLDGWRIVNTDTSTWVVRNGSIVTSGKPIGELCTTQQYENFILEIEWRHLHEGGNAGLFIHSDPLPAVGQPFTRAIENQVMDGNHGDVFAIHGATMKPDRPHPRGWMRSLPIEERANPTGEWNHYRVESHDGTVSLAVNGKVVSGGTEISPRKGYICLESEGSEAHFRHIRIRELPSTNPAPDQVADLYDGHVSLYSGVDLDGWTGGGPWVVDDWILRNDGTSTGGNDLWTSSSFQDFEMFADFRLDCEEAAGRSGIHLRRGTEARLPVGCSSALRDVEGPTVTEATANERGWQRVHVRVEGRRATISRSGEIVARMVLPDGSPTEGPIGLIDAGQPIEVANIFIKELDR